MRYKGLIRVLAEKLKFLNKILGSMFPPLILVKILEAKFNQVENFKFNDNTLKYFYHSYRNNRLTERAIEIPIIRHYMEKEGSRNFLEIGNVTNHYYTYFQDIIDSKVVVDKYEKGWGVNNKDINEYRPDHKFNFIFSISTFEHMDSDAGDNPEYVNGDSKLITYAADNVVHVCHNLLNEGGIFILTAPIAAHTEWDQTLFSAQIFKEDLLKVKSIKIFFFRKISEIEWVQTNIYYAKKSKYNKPFTGANVLSIVEIRK